MSKVIGIIGAMDEEIELYVQQMQGVKESVRAGLIFYQGEFLGRQVILCKCGVGKVNAAICTQLLIDDFHVASVIFTGVAGGVDPSLNIGDIVISRDCLQHDIDASALGFKKGEIPFAQASVFEADHTLIQLAEQSAQSIADVQVITGRIVSGDQFIADREKVKDLYEEFAAACVEMEGSAVGQVCALNGVPFVIIRSLSDKADGSAHVNFVEFTKLASKRSYDMLAQMVPLMENEEELPR